MARLLVFWSHPAHLTVEEADRWTRAQLDELLAADGIERADLMRVEPASQRHSAAHDWMLELRLRPDTDAADWVSSPRSREWLADLRLLGMRPAVLLAAERE